MILDAGILRGYPKERVELYGKPHLGARYTHGKAYEALSPRCCVCGRRAGSVHHVAHRSWGETFRLVTPCGAWDLRSPLFCLCGSGTGSVVVMVCPPSTMSLAYRGSSAQGRLPRP